MRSERPTDADLILKVPTWDSVCTTGISTPAVLSFYCRSGPIYLPSIYLRLIANTCGADVLGCRNRLSCHLDPDQSLDYTSVRPHIRDPRLAKDRPLQHDVLRRQGYCIHVPAHLPMQPNQLNMEPQHPRFLHQHYINRLCRGSL